MKSLYIFLILLFTLSLTPSVFYAQSFVWGVKGGLTAGSQRWGNGGTYDNSLLFQYHGAAFIENAPENPTSVLFAQLGYHIRGSAYRYRKSTGVDFNGNTVNISAFTQQFKFGNIALILGAKRRGVLGQENAFYAIGLRGEYTVNTNLEAANALFSFYSQPQKEFVRKFNYGLTVAGGYEFPFSDFVGGLLEVSIHPDISKQYFRPPFIGWDPFQRQNVQVQEQSIRNLSIEISLGIKLLRKVEYVD